MRNKYFYLSKNIFLFAITGLVPKILSFILVPIYTRFLTTAEYGVADLISTTVLLFVPIFTLDIQDAVMRFAMDERYQKEDVFSTAISIISKGFLFVLGGTVFASFLNIPNLNNTYLLFFILMYLTTSIYNSVSLFCRGINKVSVMMWGGIINSAVTLSTNVLFLVRFGWGLPGYLAANSLGAIIALTYCVTRAKLWKYIRLRVTKQVKKDMVAFSFPLIFSVIAWWINNASDRYILSWMSGVAVSGIYAAAYKMPNLLAVFQNIFTQAWSISAIKEFSREDSDGFIGNMYTLMNFSMAFACSCIMLMNIPIARLLFSNDFFMAWEYVPPLLISSVFNAMALFIGSIFTAVKDTKTLSMSTIIGALCNVVCNIVLIRYMGAYGAALATLIGYGVTFAMRHIILRKHIVMRVNWMRDIAVYALLVIQMFVSQIGERGIWMQVVLLTIILGIHYDELKKVPKMIIKLSRSTDK